MSANLGSLNFSGYMRRLLLLTFLTFFTLCLHAQTMIGIVTEAATGKPLDDVLYENIFSSLSGTTDSSGRFTLSASAGQLIVFQKLGYRTVRVRIPPGHMPPFFKIPMEPGALQLDEVEVLDRHRNYHNDSLRNASIYESEIRYPKMSAVDKIQHPFTALSKHYQSIMRFQKEYNYLEQQKYIDYAFNEKMITNLTGLQGDDLHQYMRQYRPTYEMLRSMPDYYFYSYIKESAQQWQRRKGRRPAPQTERGGY